MLLSLTLFDGRAYQSQARCLMYQEKMFEIGVGTGGSSPYFLMRRATRSENTSLPRPKCVGSGSSVLSLKAEYTSAKRRLKEGWFGMSTGLSCGRTAIRPTS